MKILPRRVHEIFAESYNYSFESSNIRVTFTNVNSSEFELHCVELGQVTSSRLASNQGNRLELTPTCFNFLTFNYKHCKIIINCNTNITTNIINYDFYLFFRQVNRFYRSITIVMIFFFFRLNAHF